MSLLTGHKMSPSMCGMGIAGTVTNYCVTPKITEDVAKGGIVTKEQVIAQAQYLDLVYT